MNRDGSGQQCSEWHGAGKHSYGNGEHDFWRDMRKARLVIHFGRHGGLKRLLCRLVERGDRMTITDELRKLARRRSFTAEELLDIADRIDAAHKKAMDEAYNKGREDGINASYVPADEWIANHPYALAERGWHQAVDADDKPIHIGSLAKYNGSVGKVTQIAYTIAAVIVTTDKWVTWKLNEVHVVDTLTVEDVLEELLREYDRDDSDLTNGEIIGRFAARLRLAGDAE